MTLGGLGRICASIGHAIKFLGVHKGKLTYAKLIKIEFSHSFVALAVDL